MIRHHYVSEVTRKIFIPGKNEAFNIYRHRFGLWLGLIQKAPMGCKIVDIGNGKREY